VGLSPLHQKEVSMAKKAQRETMARFTGEIGDGVELPDGKPIGEGKSIDEQPVPRAGAQSAATAGTGDAVLALARLHLGERYILGARAPMANRAWRGPWDCAEFASWCVYQASGVLFGTRPQDDPVMADAYTGYWYEQASRLGAIIDWRDAAGISGAAVLRRPRAGQIGHIVLSDGHGGTVEAHSRLRGVVADKLSNRRWDCGILVPGVRYLQSDDRVALVEAPQDILRVSQPLMRGPRVLALQQRLAELGYPIGDADSIYGPQTAFAVRAFQARSGLVADGEAGPATLGALAKSH
jgi:N-acetylmuramoyl-L-alanine amidase